MIECDWCGNFEDDKDIHTYIADGPYHDILYVCKECYNKSKEKKEKIRWEKLKKERQKKEG